MSTCCMGHAITGRHDKSCAMGKAASEAAPEYTSPAEIVRRVLTDKDRAKIDAMIEKVNAAKLKALRDTKGSGQ